MNGIAEEKPMSFTEPKRARRPRHEPPLGIPSIEEPDLIGARLFHQLEISGALLRQLLLEELCPNREFDGDKYQTVLEIADAIVV